MNSVKTSRREEFVHVSYISKLKVDFESLTVTMATPHTFALPTWSVRKQMEICVINHSRHGSVITRRRSFVLFSPPLSTAWVGLAASAPTRWLWRVIVPRVRTQMFVLSKWLWIHAAALKWNAKKKHLQTMKPHRNLRLLGVWGICMSTQGTQCMFLLINQHTQLGG